jgi:glutamyl-tRNA(Gln) amidotransferase subunit E
MFEFKPFDEMTPEDYAAIGLRSGLEIHQQILTEKKIFCRCPAGLYSHEYDSEILRHMRPTLSELGEYDGTALMEFKTKKEIIYRLNRDSVCTYEMDDTPPFMLNDEALDIALEVAMMLDLNLVNELHIARKQYLDGSIPTGFQRTTIVGVDGWIPYKGRRIGIYQLGLEEDSCREVSDVGHRRVYLTDRLGMPLIEPVTHPDMHTPQEVAEVGEVLRRLMRSTGKVRTGHGTTRMDVNVSVAGSTRVEIKGVPSLRRTPKLVYNEAMRQWNLLRIRDLLAGRGITPDTVSVSTADVTALLGKTGYRPVRKELAAGAVARAIKLEGFAGVLDERTQTDTVLAQEFSDRVRVVACLTTLPNMVYSGDRRKTLSSSHWRAILEALEASGDDVVVVTWGSEADAGCAASEIEIRAREAVAECPVPGETRQAHDDGTNGFERILPGPERMYPDTDLPPIVVGRERFDRIRKRVPEPVWERENTLCEAGLSDDVVARLVISPRYRLYRRLTGEAGIAPILAGEVLARRLVALERTGLDTASLSDDLIVEVLTAHSEGRLAREGIVLVLGWLIEAGSGGDGEGGESSARVDAALGALGLSPQLDEEGLREDVARTISAFDMTTLRKPEAAHECLMGVLMRRLAGKAEGAAVARALEARLKMARGV